MIFRHILSVGLLLILCSNTISAKNYIRYHQKSLVVQEYMARGETVKALALLDKLEKRYGLMPTETFARAMCQVAIGDTAAARRAYLQSLEQHGLLYWFYVTPPPMHSTGDTLWYAGVVHDAKVYRKVHPEFVDGPIGTVPTVVTAMDRAHQQFLDSPAGRGTDPASQAAYRSIQLRHDAMLDSMIAGQLPIPSVYLYGVNTEFQTFIYHVSPAHAVARQKYFRLWLKKGLIYPDDYAVSVDGPAYRQQRPMCYKIYRSGDDERVISGYEKRRWRIGMGNDRLHARRFHRPG